VWGSGNGGLVVREGCDGEGWDVEKGWGGSLLKSFGHFRYLLQS